jgi:diguanylate cyclase (GGDEF)-like protein/PAS domain S-box-containing protein
MYKLSADVTESLTKLLHNLQLERGLCAGMIADDDNKSSYISSLKKQFKKTDKSYNDFLYFVNLNSHNKRELQQLIQFKNASIEKEIIQKLHRIKTIRAKVLNSEITFNDEMRYYTDINNNLLGSIKIYTVLLSWQNYDSASLFNLQKLKEKAGLERAYLYNQLLSNTFKLEEIEKIKELQLQQDIMKEEFFSEASIKSTMLYTDIMDIKILNQIEEFRKSFYKHTLNSTYAKQWFKLTTVRIDRLEKISTEILNSYIHHTKSVYTDALRSLYLATLLWIISLIALAVLSYIVKVLLEKEKEHAQDLRIAAYTFDSHEAITITDVNGIIIRVNKAFSEITGYEASEVIGKNHKILKSMKHSRKFYKKMWHQLHTVGMWRGEIYNKRKNGEIYPEQLSITAIKNDKGITTNYIAQFSDISDIKKEQEKIKHKAGRDFLTGLLNRKSLMQRLKEEFRKAKRGNFLHAYLFIDLDKFKNINDDYGHDIGDKLLIKVAARMKSVLREEDVVARISGDEFAIMILNIDKDTSEAAKDLEVICTKLLNQISKPFLLNEYKLNISASIGIRLFPTNEKSSKEVAIHADAAMYKAKKEGKNRFAFFDKAIELKLKQFTLIKEELTHAYENEEFKFYYQAKVDTCTNKITGAEMLLRWLHPTKGILYPDAYLDIASEIGMTPKITKLALQTACEFLSVNSHIFKGSLAININLSELIHPAFEQEIISIIEHYAVDPSKIELEITENELMKDFDVAVSKIKKLQAFGLKFAIDDFGMGYSSITYLQKLPVNTLKIDKYFMLNLSHDKNKELVKIIIDIAKTFNIEVLIEGIEEESQLHFIQESGVGKYQGFYFSKAVDEESFIKLLQ